MSQPQPLRKPAYAHHRLMRELLKVGHEKDQIDPRPEELDNIARVFRRVGGSWERLYHGSMDDLLLLRKIIKRAVKQGLLTKAPDWKG